MLAIFVVELGLRIYGHGLRFFRDPWGVFNLTVVAIALMPASEGFAVLRAVPGIGDSAALAAEIARLRAEIGALRRDLGHGSGRD